MARKHLLADISSSPTPKTSDGPSETRADYARRGASRSMMQSLDEMAENSMRVLEGRLLFRWNPLFLMPQHFPTELTTTKTSIRRSSK